jgi:hypothetical protein
MDHIKTGGNLHESQKKLITLGYLFFAITPREELNSDAVHFAIDTPRGICKINRYIPEGHILIMTLWLFIEGW